MQKITIKNISIGLNQPLSIISGPCVIESEEHTMKAAEFLKNLFKNRKSTLIFKSSYDKATRSSGATFRGPGLHEGLRILEKVQKELDLPVLTDIHSPEDATTAGEVCDVLQIPAFLCRQTDLILSAAKTGCVINVKKGQFMAPWDMKNVINKIVSENNHQILLTDRGTSFGYNNLVSDMRAIPIMQGFGYPVCFDASHSVMVPGGLGDRSGGQREFIPILAQSAVAAGCNCVFIESHPNPAEAKSDASSVIDFKDLPALLDKLERIYEVVHG
jgi:2-dehydro-3-deoxyphosphooctonate aldolase (KDO 8-P synthase)